MFRLKKYIATQIIKKSLSDRSLPLGELEKKHSNPDEVLFNDSSYFLGRGEDGSYMVVRQAFRTSRGNEYWLRLYFPETGSLELKGMAAEEGEGFQLGTLKFTCIEPGETWEINYKGQIHGAHKIHELDLSLTFTGIRRLINFKEITDPKVTASVIAREKWDRLFFQKMKEIKKVHLEQGGRLQGHVLIDGKKTDINWRSIRDHSWGNRTWGKWKRHIWLSGVLDNDEVFNVSMISYDFMGQLAAGYITSGTNTKFINQTPDMDSFAGDPFIPDECSIKFRSTDQVEHTLSVRMAGHFRFIMDNEYYIHEGMGDFTLDGIHGKGVAEFGLNPREYVIEDW